MAPGSAAGAKALALLMEEFCHEAAPEAFEVKDGAGAFRFKQGNPENCIDLDAYLMRRTLIKALDVASVKSVIAELGAVAVTYANALDATSVTPMIRSAHKDDLIAELSACLEIGLASDPLNCMPIPRRTVTLH